TGSRGALVGTAAGLTASLRWPRTLTLRRTVAVAVLIASVSVPFEWYFRQDPLVLIRVRRTAEGDAKGMTERLMLWQAAWDAFEAHPVLGVGYGQFRNYAHVATGENKLAHQTYLSIAAELGVAGLLVFGYLFASVLRDTLNAKRGPYPGVTLAGRGYVVATLIQGMFNNVQHSRALWICIGVLAAQSAAAGLGGARASRRLELNGSVWRPP
ncbi:MAG TPA: O-antigen ligase family protein, partial [Gemmatimonadales bacterium]|nr:O-antigen ligase family protein [Gemmatimonadales bacterium]